MLSGKTVAITRSQDDASEFISLAKENGAIPVALPTIELVSKGEKIVDEFLESVEKYRPDYSVFMSSKAVKLLFDTAKQLGKLEKLQLAVANTIVIMMGLSRIDVICKQLIAGGMDKKTPVAVIQNGTTPQQKMIKGNVTNIAKKVKENKIIPPTNIIIGKVVDLSDVIGWK